MTTEKAIIIGKTSGAVISTLIAVLIALVGYIYVQDRVEQKERDRKIERRLDIMDIQLDIMTDALIQFDPEIRNKVWRQKFESKARNYRGIKKK